MADCLIKLDQFQDAYHELGEALSDDPHSVVAQVEMARLLAAAGESREPRTLLSSALAESPANEEAALTLAEIDLREGRPAAAEQLYRSALAHNAGAVEIAITYAQQLHSEHRDDEAGRVLTQAIDTSGKASSTKAQPEMAENAWLALARLKEEQGDFAGAENTYLRAGSAFNSEITVLHLAQFYERHGRIADAQSALQQLPPTARARDMGDLEFALGRPSAALDYYVAAPAEARVQARLIEAEVQADRTVHARLLLAMHRAEFDQGTATILESEIALAEGDAEGGLRLARSAVNLAPDSAPAQYALANLLLASGDPASGARALHSALDLDADFSPAAIALAQVRLAHGDAASAEQLLIPVLQREPANLQALVAHGQVLTASRRFDSAHTIVGRALAINPQAASAHAAAAELASAEGSISGAVAEYQLALSADPNDRSALDGLTQLYQRGRVNYRMIEELETIASRPPQSSALLQLAARLYAKQGWYQEARRCLEHDSASLSQAQEFESRGRLNEAAKLYEAALRQGDSSGIAANNLAWIYLQQQKLDRALELSQTAQKLRPTDPAVMDTAALVHLRRHETAQAIALLHDAARIAHSDHADAQVIAAIRGHLLEAEQSAGKKRRNS
ncbi:MAG: tetratricopeptide repeat protein [Acidobacteriaceae bacterium]